MTEETARPLGESLRRRREELGISLEQAQTDTRIRARYLEALEAEDFAALPDPIVGRGFLRNYAAYLNLDAQEAANRYSARVAPPEPEVSSFGGSNPFAAGPFEPLSLHEMPSSRSRRAWLLGALAVVAVALSVLVWWGLPYLAPWLASLKPSGRPVATPVTPVSTVAPATATRTPLVVITAALPTTSPTPATPTATSLEATELTLTFTPSPTLTPSPPVYTGIFLELVFTGTSWIQVAVDGVRQEQGELPDGTYRSYYGTSRIELRIGNAGVVVVTVNGERLGTLGGVGEVVDRVFEISSGELSEATVTPVTPGTPTVAASTLTPTQPPPTGPTAPPTTPEAPAISPTATLSATATLAPTATP